MKRVINQNRDGFESSETKKKPTGKFLKSTVGVGAVVVILALVMIIRGIGVQPDIIENKQTISELETKIAEEKERQALAEKDTAGTLAYAEEIQLFFDNLFERKAIRMEHEDKVRKDREAWEEARRQRRAQKTGA